MGAHVAGAVAELPDLAAEDVEFGDPPALDDEQRPLPARVASGLEGGQRIACRVRLLPPGETRAALVAFAHFPWVPSVLVPVFFCWGNVFTALDPSGRAPPRRGRGRIIPHPAEEFDVLAVENQPLDLLAPVGAPPVVTRIHIGGLRLARA